MGMSFGPIVPNPQPIKYLFIDGGYIRQEAATYSSIFFNDTKFDLTFQGFISGFAKIFYYDCLPEKKELKKDFTPEERESVLKHNEERDKIEKYFNSLKLLDNFHVVLGEIRREAKKNKQKGVDIAIAVDMLMHSNRGNMQEATLMTGDLDFKPLFKELVQQGMRTVLWHGKSVSDELKYAADSVRKITVDDINENISNPIHKDDFPSKVVYTIKRPED